MGFPVTTTTNKKNITDRLDILHRPFGVAGPDYENQIK